MKKIYAGMVIGFILVNGCASVIKEERKTQEVSCEQTSITEEMEKKCEEIKKGDSTKICEYAIWGPAPHDPAYEGAKRGAKEKLVNSILESEIGQNKLLLECLEERVSFPEIDIGVPKCDPLPKPAKAQECCGAVASLSRSAVQRRLKEIKRDCERIIKEMEDVFECAGIPPSFKNWKEIKRLRIEGGKEEEIKECLKEFSGNKIKGCSKDERYYVYKIDMAELKDISSHLSIPTLEIKLEGEEWMVRKKGNLLPSHCRDMKSFKRAIEEEDFHKFLEILGSIQPGNEDIPYWIDHELKGKIYERFREFTPELWKRCGNGEDAFQPFVSTLERILGKPFLENWRKDTKISEIDRIAYLKENGEYERCIRETDNLPSPEDSLYITPLIFIYRIKCLEGAGLNEEKKALEEQLKRIGIIPENFCIYYSSSHR